MSLFHHAFFPRALGQYRLLELRLSPKSFTSASRQPWTRSPLQLRLYSSNITTPSQSIRRARIRRIFNITAFSIFFTSAGFLIATAPAVASIVALMAAPTDAESVAMYKAPDEVAAQINNYINTHPLAVSLRSDPAWKESRPHLRYPENYKKHSLTAGTLLGPGRIPVPPLVFSDGKSLLSMSYLGTDLCGHVGVVHGGMLATMLDEGLARCAFESLPNRIGVTATLTVNYKKPVPAGSFLVLRSETTKVEGRKVWVKGSIEILGEDEKLSGPLVEAEGLFIEPKYAKALPRLFTDEPKQASAA